MKNQIYCAITGTTTEAYSPNAEMREAVSKTLKEQIRDGVTDYLCNAEQGFPLWICEILIDIRDTRLSHSLSAPQLHLIMPNERQADDYDDETHERFFDVHAKVDTVTMLPEDYQDNPLENSERFMVDGCDFLFTDDKSGFGARFAAEENVRVVVCPMFVKTVI
jgi:uncharacterized phage-like protein YoqJ